MKSDLSTITNLCLHESLFSYVIDFFLTDAYPKFVYKLDINNHKTVSNKKDVNNLFNFLIQSLMNLNQYF